MWESNMCRGGPWGLKRASVRSMNPLSTAEKGKPGASRGRKARGLAGSEMARLPAPPRKVSAVMNYRSITRRAAGMAVLLASVVGGSAQAATLTGVSACSAPSYSFSQPFASAKDWNWYTLAPGQSVNSFNGAGWTLTGGAKIVTTTLADGTTGQVLDLPAGSTGVSPPMCVSDAYPTAKAVVRDLVGAPSVHLFVSYTNAPSWEQPAASGTLVGTAQWGNSQALQLHPGNLYGWQEERFTLTGGSYGSNAQVYNFWVDPRCAY
jgi:hypothetical protein